MGSVPNMKVALYPSNEGYNEERCQMTDNAEANGQAPNRIDVRWLEDDDGLWGCSGCDMYFSFENGGPKENKFNYCPKCGARIAEYCPFEDKESWYREMCDMDSRIEKLLPDGTALIAETWDEPEYPGIRISLKLTDGTEECLCFAEFNTAKPKGRQLCIAAYAHNVDDPAYYESYYDDGSSSANV